MSTLKVKGLVVFFSLALFSLAVQAQGQSGRVEISGEAAVEIADYFEEDRSELYYFIIDKQSRARTRVFFPGLPDAAFRSGATVRIHGRSRGNGRGVDVDFIEILEPAPRPGGDPGIEAPVAPNQTRKVLTLIVNFLDAVVDTGTQNAVTPTIVSNQMFHDTRNIQHFYETASLGTLAMPSDPNAIGKEAIFGPYTIPYNYLTANGGTCSADIWADAALTAWEADAVGNPTRETRSDYTNWSIIVPNYWDYSGRACTWGGLAGVGCTQCWAFSADPASILFGVVIHELGHNFGFGHARYDTNNDGVSDCEYCDASDLMGGNRSWMKFNAPHFDYLGWWDPVTYEIDTITPTSTQQAFSLIPVDEEDGPWPGLRAVKTARTGSSNYYFSWRQQTGHYNNVNTPYTTGVNVHWSGLSDYASNFYRFLEAGQVFSDAGQDLLVRAEGATEVDDGFGNTTKVFTIQVCNFTCSTLWPPLSLSAAGPFPDTIKLTWEDYTYNEDGWRIEYSTDGSSWSELATVAADSTFYNHLGIAGGTTLYYRVQAYRIAAETSEWSETVSATTPPASGSYGFPIAHADDDTVQFTSGGLNGVMWLKAPYTYLGFDTPNGQSNDEGLRFRNVAIPQGATINSAYIEYRAYGSGSGDTTVTFHTEDIDDAPVFTSSSGNLTSRTFSSTSVNWTLGAWTSGQYYQSPSLTSLVQAMVDRPGWGGNAMLFVTQGTQTGTHRAYSYDNFGNSPEYAPKLVVDYIWTAPFSIGGTVSGLEGSGLVLQNNAGDDLAIDGDGSFTFATPQSDGSAYAVTVMTQPSDPSQTCIVSDGSGTVDGADVITVAVTCGNEFIFNNSFEDL